MYQYVVTDGTPSKQMEDYEFNTHRHWKGDDNDQNNDDGGTIKHFKD